MGALTQLLTQLAGALDGDEAVLRASFGLPGLLQTMQSLQVPPCCCSAAVSTCPSGSAEGQMGVPRP